MPKAYPVYDDDYQANVEVLRAWLEANTPNVHPVGRNGMHRYNNQDHSMYTAMLTVENILGGSDHDIWAVNVEEEYHEEGDDPTVADPRRAPRAPAATRRSSPARPAPDRAPAAGQAVAGVGVSGRSVAGPGTMSSVRVAAGGDPFAVRAGVGLGAAPQVPQGHERHRGTDRQRRVQRHLEPGVAEGGQGRDELGDAADDQEQRPSCCRRRSISDRARDRQQPHHRVEAGGHRRSASRVDVANDGPGAEVLGHLQPVPVVAQRVAQLGGVRRSVSPGCSWM